MEFPPHPEEERKAQALVFPSPLSNPFQGKKEGWLAWSSQGLACGYHMLDPLRALCPFSGPACQPLGDVLL